MKKCRVCGAEIINGQNGCMMLGDICFDCHGGPPVYPSPRRIDYPEAPDYLDWIEDKCLSMGYMPE